MIINPVIGGTSLPELTNPADSGQILSGYQAINQDGEVLTGTIASRGAQTITPGTSNQTIAAGQYLSGTQTIAGDSDLVAGNIKNGVNIFGVTGNYQGQGAIYGGVRRVNDTTIRIPSKAANYQFIVIYELHATDDFEDDTSVGLDAVGTAPGTAFIFINNTHKWAYATGSDHGSMGYKWGVEGVENLTLSQSGSYLQISGNNLFFPSYGGFDSYVHYIAYNGNRA